MTINWCHKELRSIFCRIKSHQCIISRYWIGFEIETEENWLIFFARTKLAAGHLLKAIDFNPQSTGSSGSFFALVISNDLKEEKEKINGTFTLVDNFLYKSFADVLTFATSTAKNLLDKGLQKEKEEHFEVSAAFWNWFLPNDR